jgi:hypothetical protein
MTAHNRGNRSNSRNESKNRTANTMDARAGILAKVVKLATAHREANYSRDTV